MAFCVLDEVFDGQVIEVWHLDHLHLITANAATLIGAQVSQMPCCHCLYGW